MYTHAHTTSLLRLWHVGRVLSYIFGSDSTFFFLIHDDVKLGQVLWSDSG